MKRNFFYLISLSILLVGCASSKQQKVITPAEVITETEQTIPEINPYLNNPIQIIEPNTENLSESEKSWIPNQIQDKLKSNFQQYLEMKIVVDEKSEADLRKIQAQSESVAHDETTIIESGKVLNAKYGVFSKVRATNSGYVLAVDFTDLTTGEQIVTATSKEYSKIEYLYGSTGAIDEITVRIGEGLGLSLSEVIKNSLLDGSWDFTIDDQMRLAKENDEKYKKMIDDYDEQIKKLSTSNNLSSIEQKKKLDAEKALVLEKQKYEQKRQEDLKIQKEQADADAKLEAERSIALKTQRDNLAKDAAIKAAEVHKLQKDSLGTLGKINVIEAKKKAIIEIRQKVYQRAEELYLINLKDCEEEKEKILNRPLGSSEKDSEGKQTSQSKERRQAQIKASKEEFTKKFISDCETVKQSTMEQQDSLLAEIKADELELMKTKIVSSLGDELKISFGPFDGSKNGWNTTLQLYSDNVLIFTYNYIVNYEALTGKAAPTEEELCASYKVQEEYDSNIDMYNSLLARGVPIVYFEVYYRVYPYGYIRTISNKSEYQFCFDLVKVINTISGEVTQENVANKIIKRKMTPEYDLAWNSDVGQRTINLFRERDILKQEIAELDKKIENVNKEYETKKRLIYDLERKEQNYKYEIKRFQDNLKNLELEQKTLNDDLKRKRDATSGGFGELLWDIAIANDQKRISALKDEIKRTDDAGNKRNLEKVQADIRKEKDSKDSIQKEINNLTELKNKKIAQLEKL